MEHPLGGRNACLDLQNEINFDFINDKNICGKPCFTLETA